VRVFYKRTIVIVSFINTIEKDIYTDCSTNDIRRFYDIKNLVTLLNNNVEAIKNYMASTDKNKQAINENAFSDLRELYTRLVETCTNLDIEYTYN
ncbi:MAG TPA: hypothetical protein VFV08_04985, partial [Puia sp.]|nr:hypothetical protein [Puia sp.]